MYIYIYNFNFVFFIFCSGKLYCIYTNTAATELLYVLYWQYCILCLK